MALDGSYVVAVLLEAVEQVLSVCRDTAAFACIFTDGVVVGIGFECFWIHTHSPTGCICGACELSGCISLTRKLGFPAEIYICADRAVAGFQMFCARIPPTGLWAGLSTVLTIFTERVRVSKKIEGHSRLVACSRAIQSDYSDECLLCVRLKCCESIWVDSVPSAFDLGVQDFVLWVGT